MKNNQIQSFYDDNLQESSEHLANTLLINLRKKISSIVENNLKQKIFIALSGGNSPKIFFNILAQNITQQEWNYIEIFQVDERCVSKSDYDLTNRKLITENLINHTDYHINCHFIELLNSKNTQTVIAVKYQSLIENLFQTYYKNHFDFIILGMGNDGHTASIFPNSELAKNETKKLVSETEAPTTIEPHVPRISLTFKAINEAENIYVLLNGADRKSVV